MTDIATWLGQQLDEDEVVAERNSDGRGLCDGWPDYQTYVDNDTKAADAYLERFGPPRALRDVAAKRKLLALHEHAEATENSARAGDFGCQTCHYDSGDCVLLAMGWCDTLRIMAEAYDDRPGYEEEWRCDRTD